MASSTLLSIYTHFTYIYIDVHCVYSERYVYVCVLSKVCLCVCTQ